MHTSDLAVIVAKLREAGCVAAEEEARELLNAADGDRDLLDQLLSRRCDGEPVAWLLGSVQFCGELVLIDHGVYVPRPQSEDLALEAVARMPERGVALDLCTGSGALALVMARRRPHSRVIATEIDPLALACARRNGVEVFEGDLCAPVPTCWQGQIDVVTAIAPYVPTSALHFLPRDVVAFEPRRALDGGEDGLDYLLRLACDCAPLMREGASLLVEIGGDQADLLEPVLVSLGYRDVEVHADEDGDVRALYCTR